MDTCLNVVDAFTDLLTADNYNISRFFSPDMDIRLIRLLSEESFDVVQLESLFMTPYIPTIRRYSQARIVLRSPQPRTRAAGTDRHGRAQPAEETLPPLSWPSS